MSSSISYGAQNPKNVTNKNLRNVTSDKNLRNVTTDKNLKNVTTDKNLKKMTTSKNLKNVTTDKNLKNVTTDKNLKNMTTNKNLLVAQGAQVPKNVTVKNLPIRENNVKNHSRVQEVGKNKMEGKNNNGSHKTESTTSNNKMLTEKRNIKQQLEMWRAERQARLAARILKNKSAKAEVSSTLLGTATPSIAVDKKISTVSSHLNSKNQQIRQLNTTIKKKATIEVRQTTASRLRMHKLNPLHGILSTSKALSDKNKTPSALFKPPNVSKPKTNCLPPKSSNKLTEKKGVQQHSSISLSSKNSGRNDSISLNKIKKIETFSQKEDTNCLRRNLFQTPSNVKSILKSVSVRRSLSVNNIDSMPDKIPLEFGPKMLNHKCSTPTNAVLNPLQLTSENEFIKPDSPQIYSSRKKSKVSLCTPDVSRKSVNVQTPHPDVMRERLVNWLSKRGKSIDTFRHLCCFGQQHAFKRKPLQDTAAMGVGNENLTPNVQQPLITDQTNKEGLCLLVSNEDDESVRNRQSQLQKVLLESNETVENILYDLRMLIISGYPRKQCEAWLHLIMKEYKNIDEQAVYWECLAALEETCGDFNTAVDYYGRAIMRGAKTENIDKSLDNLWEKFNTLNLDCKSLQNLDSGKKSTNKLVDPCQMFKSTVIKFALQQKAVKQISANLGVEPSSLQYVATPVRRSTRNSESKYKTSSAIKYVNTLHDLQPDVKNSILFHTNKALTPKV